MSTCYRLSNRDSAVHKDVLLSKLKGYGIRVVETPAPDRVQITDGSGYLMCYCDEQGRIAEFESFADSNNPCQGILDSLEEVLQETILSEHDDGFFEDDFLTEEEEREAVLN